MLKSTTALLLVYAILVVSLALPANAQQVPVKEAVQQAVKNETQAPNLKDVFAKQTEIVKADSAVFDPVMTERQAARQQAQKKGWSRTKKTWVIIAVAVGIAAVTFLAIKYYRKCLRYSDNCTYDPNTGLEDCPCEEYEPRN